MGDTLLSTNRTRDPAVEVAWTLAVAAAAVVVAEDGVEIAAAEGAVVAVVEVAQAQRQLVQHPRAAKSHSASSMRRCGESAVLGRALPSQWLLRCCCHFLFAWLLSLGLPLR